MADVEVKFGAQLDGLIAGINAAKSQIEGITAPIAGVQEAFQGLAEVAGAAFVVDKLGEFLDKFAEAGEQIERTARITGESASQIQLFTTAINLAGGDSGTAASTLNILQKNIGDAISKAGPARAAFEGMGFSLEQIAHTDVVTLLFEMKQRMDEAGGSAEQSALKMEYMRAVAGRNGAQFLALKDSLAQVKAIIDQTSSSMTPKMIEDASNLERQVKKLDLAWGGLKNTVADAASGIATSTTEMAAKGVEDINTLIKAIQYWHSMSGSGGKPKRLGSAAMQDEEDEQNTQLMAPRTGPDPSKNYGNQFGPNQNPLPQLDTGTKEDDSAEKNDISIEKSDLDEKLEMYKLDEAAKKLTDQAKVDSGQLSNQQMLADLKASLDGEKQAALAELTGEQALYDGDSAEWEELQNKKLIVAKQYDNQLLQLQLDAAKQQQAAYKQELEPWKQLMTDMGGAFDTMINGVLSGTQTFGQAMARGFDDLLIKFTEVLAKMTAEYAAFSVTGGKGILGFGATNPFAALGGAGGGGAAGGAANSGVQALTTAITGNTATTVQNTGGIVQQVESGLQWVAEALGLTSTTVAQTTASAAAATASTASATATTGLIPSIAANIAALAANTSALIVSKAIPSFDVGSWSVPGDMIAQIHSGEMIIPAAQAAQIRSGSASLGGGAGASGSGGGAFTININAIDTQTGAQFLKNNASIIAQTVSGQMRNFNPRLRPS